MRILERETNQVFTEIELFLTMDEALELSGRLEGLIRKPKAHHIHLDSDDKELTIAIYTQDNLHDFDVRSRELIVNNR